MAEEGGCTDAKALAVAHADFGRNLQMSASDKAAEVAQTGNYGVEQQDDGQSFAVTFDFLASAKGGQVTYVIRKSDCAITDKMSFK